MSSPANEGLMEKIVALCKRRGFVYPSAEIYGGLAGFFDYGPLGLALKNNIKNLWWKQFVSNRDDMFGVDAALITKKEVLEASGHVGGFSDPMVVCSKCKHRFRADQITRSDLGDGKKVGPFCPDCGGALGDLSQFNMMFQTHVGAVQEENSVAYLRPETAQGIFTNFKNVVDSFHPRLPFGIGQIGKAFRNEIAPRDFLFRLRELEQMEVEYFVKPKEWEGVFEMWRTEMLRFLESIGIDRTKTHELEVSEGDRAHYSKRTFDFDFDFPFGRKELYGLAYRTDFDLRNHQTMSGAKLEFVDEETNESFIPHVVEPSLGVERSVLAVLLSAYTEDEMNGEVRSFLKLKPAVAPIKAAVFPLLKNKPELVAKAREVYQLLKKDPAFGGAVMFDDNGNIGKRYRRQDEIGTPFCITVDFDSLEKGDVTVRARDTGKQDRMAIQELTIFLRNQPAS
ncbi:MAG: glycine--tRNA ligase [bacterium]|nr:glycine--tRNA ligase [bacterium]